MKIAITGPNGFISQNLILHFGDKHEIILLGRKKLKLKNLRKNNFLNLICSKILFQNYLVMY